MDKVFGNRWARFGIQVGLSLLAIVLMYVICITCGFTTGTVSLIFLLSVVIYFVLSTLAYWPYDAYYNVGLLEGEIAQEVQPKAKAFLKNLLLLIFFVGLAIFQLVFSILCIQENFSEEASGFWLFLANGCANGLFLAGFLDYLALRVIVAGKGKGYRSTLQKVLSPFIAFIIFIVAVAVAGALCTISAIEKYVGIILLVFLGFALILNLKRERSKKKKANSSKSSSSSTSSSSSSDDYDTDRVESKMNYVDSQSEQHTNLGTVASVSFKVDHTIAHDGNGNYTIKFTYNASVYDSNKLTTEAEMERTKKNLQTAIDNMAGRITSNAKRELANLNGNFNVTVYFGKVTFES